MLKKYVFICPFVLLAARPLWAGDFTVVSREDSGPGTLRDMIGQANGNEDVDTITFNIPSPGGTSITVYAPLEIEKPVVLDGGSAQVIGAVDSATNILVLKTGSDGSVIRNLALVNSNAGIEIWSNACCVENCRLGTNWSDQTELGNRAGIMLIGGNNVIGGPNNTQRNIIVSNSVSGIYMYTLTCQSNRIQNNYIGVDSGGNSALGNATGITVGGYAQSNMVGGNRTANEGNLIAGNNNGVLIEYTETRGNTVCGNVIGLNAGQTAAVPNNIGIFVNNTTGNFIGLSLPGCENIIAGSTYAGICLASSAVFNTVQNNWVGFNAANQLFPNYTGILLEAAPSNLIGGTGPDQGNVICGDGSHVAVSLIGDSAGNTVVGNWIGVMPDGSAPAAITMEGVRLEGSSHHNYIGLPFTGAGNRIANTDKGIVLRLPTATANGWYGNTITAFSTAGIYLDSGATAGAVPIITFASNTQVAGTVGGSGYYVEIFRAEPRPGQAGGSLAFAGSASSTAGGHWSLAPLGLVAGDYVCALSTDNAGNNTSPFSVNVAVAWTTPTFTITPTPTSTPTGTPTVTATSTAHPTDESGHRAFLAFPNPASDFVAFSAPEDARHVTLDIFNLAGERVTRISAEAEDDKHRITWNCRHAAPGIYLVQWTVDGRIVKRRKIAILR